MVEGVLAMGKIWKRAGALSSLEPRRDSEASGNERKMASDRQSVVKIFDDNSLIVTRTFPEVHETE